MQHKDGSFEGAAGHSIYYQLWTPDSAPKAVLLIVHGAGEHSGRYAGLAAHCCAAGYAVVAQDHIGHGKSDGSYGHMEEFQHHMETLEMFRQRMVEQFPELPMILLGHSMGGLISACFLLSHQREFAGCVLSGPAIKTEMEPGLIQRVLIQLLARLTPSMGVMQLDPAGVSRDPAVVKAYCEDPLVNHGKMSARFVSELFAAMAEIQARAAEIELPILIMHGAADVMTAPDGSRFLYDAVSSSDKTLKLYPGLYHEIFAEPEREEIYAELTDWCDQRLGG